MQRVHTIQTPYSCLKCTSYYKDGGSLNTHRKKYHDVDTIMDQLSLLKGMTASPSVQIINSISENTVAATKSDEVSTGKFIEFSDKLENGEVISRQLKVETINNIVWCVCEICSKKMKKPSDMIR
jgi:hypothetical protein